MINSFRKLIYLILTICVCQSSLTAQCNVNITTANGGVTITGLTNDANTKLFNANASNVLFSCNPWQGNPCSGNETVSGLIVGDTYFLSVQSAQCNEWIPIVVQGGPGGGGGGAGFNVNCPDDINITVPNTGNFSTVVNWDLSATTDCTQGGIDIEQIEGPPSGSTFFVNNSAGTLIVFRISDNCGNSESCIFNVTIFPEPPTVSCPNDITVNATSSSGAVVNYNNPSVATFCDANPLTSGLNEPVVGDFALTEGLLSGSVFPIGTTAVSYRSFLSGPVGFCQVTSNCNFNVTVMESGGGGCNVNITSSNGGVTITGLTSDANTKLFDSNITPVFSCNPWQNNPCSSTESVTGLEVGATFFLSVQSAQCNEWIPIVIQGTGGCADTDGDGVCNNDDCQPTNPNLPATPGSACNDFNSGTSNDVIQEDGCTCAGTPISGGCNVNITSSNGGVTITGLTGAENAKLFNPSFASIWACNPWNTVCTSNETVNNLTIGETFFLSVQSAQCDLWIPIVIQGTVDETLPDLSANSLSIGAGAPDEILNFTFNLVNDGNSTANGNYSIRTYVSTDPSLSNDDIQEGQINTGNTAVGSINVTGAITVPNLPVGSYFLILVVDDGNNIAESDESNNIVATGFQIQSANPSNCDFSNTSNLALSGNATQSSTLNFGGIDSGPQNAIDENADGNYFNGSVSATSNGNQEWWQVDLGANFDLDVIAVFNRSDGTDRLNSFYILTSTSPFPSGLNSLAAARSVANDEFFVSGEAGRPTNWFIDGTVARYVRIQRTGTGFVTISEASVFGCPISMPSDNVFAFEAPKVLTENTFEVATIFPNPTTGEVISRIQSEVDTELTIQVTNMTGQVMHVEKTLLEKGINSLELNLDQFSNGMYQLHFANEDYSISKRIVKIQ